MLAPVDAFGQAPGVDRRVDVFALGALLFIVTLALNVVALKIVRKYREQYD